MQNYTAREYHNHEKENEFAINANSIKEAQTIASRKRKFSNTNILIFNADDELMSRKNETNKRWANVR